MPDHKHTPSSANSQTGEIRGVLGDLKERLGPGGYRHHRQGQQQRQSIPQAAGVAGIGDRIQDLAQAVDTAP